MIVNIDYDEAYDVLQEELIDENAVLRCQNPECKSARLDWYREDDRLVVDCEDCGWKTEQRFDDTRYQ